MENTKLGTKNKLLHECWCIFATKLKIYKDRIEIGRVFGLSVTTIPTQKIASIHNGLSGIKIETTGGGKTDLISPWNANNKKMIVEIMLGITK